MVQSLCVIYLSCSDIAQLRSERCLVISGHIEDVGIKKMMGFEGNGRFSDLTRFYIASF